MELPEPSEEQRASWRVIQERIAENVIRTDDFEWSLESTTPLYVAGVDVSFAPDNETKAVATAVIVEHTTAGTRLIYSTSAQVRVTVRYAAGYLAFRELPFALQVLRSLPSTPQPHVLLVDGNGELHHRGAGLACHLGQEMNMPTIGIGKNLLHVDSLDDKTVREAVARSDDGLSMLVGASGRTWGAALLTGNSVTKPIFVSVGHRICLQTAVSIVRKLCKFRVPEPVRMADMHSREGLRTGQLVRVCASDVFDSDASR